MPAEVGKFRCCRLPAIDRHGLRELTMALMLQSERNMTLAALLWGFWTMGNATGAAAVGIWLTVAMGILVLLWQLVMDRDKEA